MALENKFMVTKGGRVEGRIHWEDGNYRCTLPYIFFKKVALTKLHSSFFELIHFV